MEENRIYYLNQKEKQLTRTMYEAVFSEDSKKFVDYYYKWKIKDNNILVMEEACLKKPSFFQVMIHFNPYILWINGNLQKIPYIVAVATHPNYRKQGKMGQVMTYALRDMEAKQIPFTFLLPANPNYYKGQGFIFFPNQEQSPYLRAIEKEQNQTIKAAIATNSYLVEKNLQEGLRWQKAKPQDIPQMITFSNLVLEKKYHIFVKRDMYYYQRLFAETATENGGILLLKFQEQLQGMLVYGVSFQNCQVEVKELLLKDDVWQEEAEILCQRALPDYKINFDSSPMMIRVTNLFVFVSLLRSEYTHCYNVKVEDSMITSQQGCYRIEIGTNKSKIEKISENKVEQKLDISELTQLLLKDTIVYLKEWV